MKNTILNMAVIFAAGCAVKGRPEAADLIKILEESLVLPVDSQPIRKYDRTYAFGPNYIKGILLLNGSEEGELRVVPENHLHMERMDGGCGAIKVIYDRIKRRWISAVCNGSA